MKSRKGVSISASLTRERKICAAETIDLLSWAQANRVTVQPCKDCWKGELPKARRAKVDLLKYEATPFEYFGERMISDGEKSRVTVNKYERNPRNRMSCIEHYGAVCIVCNFEFATVYPGVRDGYIHVHHLKPASEGVIAINPVKDLVPVCPNCHAMLHTEDPPITPEQLKRRLSPFFPQKQGFFL